MYIYMSTLLQFSTGKADNAWFTSLREKEQSEEQKDKSIYMCIYTN